MADRAVHDGAICVFTMGGIRSQSLYCPPMPVRYQAAPRPDARLVNDFRRCSFRPAAEPARELGTLGMLRLLGRRCCFYTLRPVRSSAEARDGAVFRPYLSLPPDRAKVATSLPRRAVQRRSPIPLLRVLRSRERPAIACVPVSPPPRLRGVPPRHQCTAWPPGRPLPRSRTLRERGLPRE
jgi:hypothetical protein